MSRTPSKNDRQGLMTRRERAWAAVRALGADGAVFTAWTVQDACEPMVQFPTVALYLRGLARAGYLREVKATAVQREHGARHSTPEYVLVKSGYDAPRVDGNGKAAVQGIGVLAMWRAMRVLKSFDFRDISRAATLGAIVVTETTALKYVQYLAHAGYFQELRKGTRQLPARYRLVRNTGPHAPAITREKVVLDRNTGALAVLATPQEVCDGIE